MIYKPTELLENQWTRTWEISQEKKQERTGPEWSDSEELAAGSELENRRNSLEQKKKKKKKKKT